MFGNKSKIASSRRLKVPLAHENTNVIDPAFARPAAAAAEQGTAKAQQTYQPRSAPPASAPQHIKKTSKAQALAAFHGLVESASRARLGLPPPGVPAPTAKAVAVTGHHNEPQGTRDVDGQGRVGCHSAAADTGLAAPHAAPVPNPQPATDSGPQPSSVLQQQPQRPLTGPTAPAAIRVNPTQLLCKALTAVQKLQQQLSSRTLTYLYQFDTLLQQAKDALSAVAKYISADAGGCALQQLLPIQTAQKKQKHEDTAAYMVLDLSTCTWVGMGVVAAQLQLSVTAVSAYVAPSAGYGTACVTHCKLSASAASMPYFIRVELGLHILLCYCRMSSVSCYSTTMLQNQLTQQAKQRSFMKLPGVLISCGDL